MLKISKFGEAIFLIVLTILVLLYYLQLYLPNVYFGNTVKIPFDAFRDLAYIAHVRAGGGAF